MPVGRWRRRRAAAATAAAADTAAAAGGVSPEEDLGPAVAWATNRGDLQAGGNLLETA